MATTAPSVSPVQSLEYVDTIGFIGIGAAAGTGVILVALAALLESRRDTERGFDKFDALLLAGFAAAVTNAVSGVELILANSRSFTNTADLAFSVPILLRCVLPGCVLLHIQYYKFLENHWNWKSDVVKLVISNLEALDVLFVMTPILNGNVYVEFRVNDFDLYGATIVYALLWILRKVHVAYLFKDKATTRASRSNIVYRSISLNTLPLNVVVLVMSFLPLSIYLAVHTSLGWKSDDRTGAPARSREENESTTEVPVPTNDEVTSEEAGSSPNISRLELLAYFASLGIDIYLAVDLGSALGTAPPGNSVAQLVIDLSFAFALCLIGLDIATLKSYFVADETLATIEEEGGRLSRIYNIYLASARVESYLLLCLLGVLAGTLASSGQDPLGLVFVVIDYLIVNLRLWLRLRSIAQVNAFDIEGIGLIETFFPLNVIYYGIFAAYDIALGLIQIPAIVYGSFQVLVYGRWLPKGNLQKFLELASTNAY